MRLRRTQAKRYHDICAGHRVHGQGGKCEHLHGHNYRVHFMCEAELGNSAVDGVGRVIDFSDIKERLCMWLEENWDHKFLAWIKDPLMGALYVDREPYVSGAPYAEDCATFTESIVWVPFNPTAENMAQYLVETVGPKQLDGTGIELVEVTIEETAKCSATYKKESTL